MNYIVPSRTLRDLKSRGMRANSFYDLVKSKSVACQRFIIPSFNLKVSSSNQNPIVNVELPSFGHMKGTSFMVNTLEHIVDVVVYCSHYVEPFVCGGGAEFIVVAKVYSTWIKSVETSLGGDFVRSGGSRVVGKFCKR